MTSQQPPHPHSGYGPGPSYYHQPPPPNYDPSSPGPNQHYAYQYPPQPPSHMNHPSGPSRANGRGGGPYNHRNHNPNPYNYYPPYGHHPGPIPMQGPNIHSYPANQPYSSAYAYLNPAAVPFTPQPMSPMSKRPAIPTTVNHAGGYYESSEFPPAPQIPPPQIPILSPQAQKPHVAIPPVSEPSDSPSEPTSHERFEEEESSSLLPQTVEGQNDAQASLEPSSPVLQPSVHGQIGTMPPLELTFLQDSTSSVPSETSSDSTSAPEMSWTIWSRRPRDPSHAPGIIISPRARPPPKIVEGASDTKTPPISPPSSPVISPEKRLLPSRDSGLLEAVSSQTSSTVPSSASTENADTPTVPGSPVSTNTSLSISAIHPEESKAKEEPKPEPQTAVAAEVEPKTLSVAELPASEGIATPTIAVETLPAAVQPSTSEPGSVPVPTVPPPKKSWASLLRPAAGASGSAASAKNALPTSSIVGFSIPGGDSSTAQPVSPTKKSELVNLLTTNPSNAPFVSKIRPRGLVNSGNMCFANSVLQILVYCAPFHRLFVELGKVLPVVSVEKENSWAVPSSTTPASTSATPLVDATSVFLKEFLSGKKLLNNGKPGLMSGVASGSGYGRKGKEREFHQMEDDDWDGDSFLPTYIYDAMKAKKRFDTMRGGQQEDAEEFLGFYLDTLEEELLLLLNSVSPSQTTKPHVEEVEVPIPREEGWMEVGKKNRSAITRTIKATESPITRIFGGKFRSTLRAPRQKDSVVFEDWRSLRLDIQRDQIRTIQDALSYISHPQPVQVTVSTQPGVPVEATQQVLIESLPPILVLHIKRFCYDTNVKGVAKVGKQVLFGPELEIGPELMAPATKKAGPTRYKLFGAVYHHGLSASGGHYTLDVLHPNRYPSYGAGVKPKEGWVRIDDDLVSDVRPEDVFGAQDRDDSRCAYLLFYRKI